MKIHYFQRYTEKENVVTNNTMLLLSRLYNYSPYKFYNFLKNFVENEYFEPEISFNTQVKEEKSVPDAVISQASFKIIVETKLDANAFDTKQLKNHLESFSQDKYNILISLAPSKMNQEKIKSLDNDIEAFIKEHNNLYLQHINTTFEDIISTIESVLVDNTDYEMQQIVNDYFDYCLDENLINNNKYFMRTQLAGTTLDFNIKNDMYYDKERRGFGNYGYIGLYKDKSVKAIGKIIARVIAYEKDGKLILEKDSKQDYDNNEQIDIYQYEDKIKKAIEDSQKYGYDLKTIPHRYIFVDKFYDTDFKKESKGGLPGSKKFLLSQYIDKDVLSLSTKEIADLLKKQTWN